MHWGGVSADLTETRQSVPQRWIEGEGFQGAEAPERCSFEMERRENGDVSESSILCGEIREDGKTHNDSGGNALEQSGRELSRCQVQ